MIPSTTIKAGKNHVACSEILMLTANINYTNIHLVCGKSYIVTKTIKRFEEMLAGWGFIRVNRSVIVNRAFVEKYHHPTVIMTNGAEHKLPRRKGRIEDLNNTKQ